MRANLMAAEGTRRDPNNSGANQTPKNYRMCSTLGDCPNQYAAVLAELPPGSTVTDMSTGAMYCDLDRL